MEYPVLQQYLSRLRSSLTKSQLWLDEQGRARGRYFNASLSSVFQPVRDGGGQVYAYEAYARSFDSSDQGLHVWRLLEYVANDEESVELDRLCRLLHAINFYRQPESRYADLYLIVHSRLLAAVEGNHGAAFRRILETLELPHEQIVLQMPLISPSQRWVLNHVVENYRRNGFRIGVNAASVAQALDLLERVRPDVIKIDAETAIRESGLTALLEQGLRQNAQVVFRRIEREASWTLLQRLNEEHYPLLTQGFLFDLPDARLARQNHASTLAEHTAGHVAPQAGIVQRAQV